MNKLIIILCFYIFSTGLLKAQSETELISNTLLDYIEGTANGQPDRLRQAFHPDFELYFVGSDSLNVWSGEKYISNITEGKKSNRVGRIVSIDYENNAASAKVEILMPGRKRIYTDYFLLLKIEGHWKIIHKSFTYVDYP